MTGAAISLDDARKERHLARRLVARVVTPGALSPATIDEAYALFAAAYAGTDRSRFANDLAEKQRVILLHDRETGQLKGFSTVLLSEIATSRGPATLVFSGDTVVDRAYWGQKELQLAVAALLLSLKLRQPRRPLYWFLISKGYRTYLILANAFPRSIPRDGAAEDAELRAMLDHVAGERFGDEYNAATGIIRHTVPQEYVRDGVAPVTAAALRNRHVRFFVDRNPSHGVGDELACLAVVRVRDLLIAMARFLVRRASRMVGFDIGRSAR
jgi:hypothetical protein